MNLYIGNLANEVTDENLHDAFSEYGKVESAKVIKDKFSNLSRGFGFVEMPNNSEADAAIKGLNGEELMGKALQISEARPKTEKRRGHHKGGGYNSGRGGQRY
jgi:RNA recognition motif-containing protein